MTYVSTQLRELTIERARGCCEYCRISQAFGAVVEALSPEGRATIFVLHINDQERIEQRELLIQFEQYPCQNQ